MIRIGFIDYYLDEWHANHYPALIGEVSGGRYAVTSAFGMIDSPIGGMTNREWSEKYGIPLRDTIEEVVRENDVLIVLSPDNPEMHPVLCDLPLRSGKRVYVDKTFAEDGDEARAIFAVAEESGTPVWSSSALRFSTELCEMDRGSIARIYTEGPGLYHNYAIHQIEMILSLMQSRAERVMWLGDETHPSMLIAFADGRKAQLYHRNDAAYSFRVTTVDRDNAATAHDVRSDFFRLFIEALVAYFDTGAVPVTHEETVNVIAIRAAGIRAMAHPFTWVTV